jgi:hypothetical protein
MATRTFVRCRLVAVDSREAQMTKLAVLLMGITLGVGLGATNLAGAAPARYYPLVRGDYINFGAADVTCGATRLLGRLGMDCYRNTKHGRYSSFTTGTRVYIMLGSQVVVSYPTSQEARGRLGGKTRR